MPTKTNRNRLNRVAQQLLARPVPDQMTNTAVERFRATGELPEDQRIGATLFTSIQSRIEVARFPNGNVDWGATIAGGFGREPRGKDDFMDGLISEGLFARGIVRVAARQMLRALSASGLDVTSALFADRELPTFGSVGLTLMGFPMCLARRPHVRQVRRLVRRIETLQRDLQHSDHRWFAELSRAVECFQLCGERPVDSLMLEAMLVLGELNAFTRHACGEDVRELLSLFDAIATQAGEEREPLIQQLVGNAQDGLLRPDE